MIVTNGYSISFIIYVPGSKPFDILDTNTVLSLSAIEFAGGNVPVVKAEFTFNDNKVVSLFRETMYCELTIKSTKEDSFAIVYPLRIVETQTPHEGNNAIKATLMCTTDLIPFYKSCNTRIFKNMCSRDVIMNIAWQNNLKHYIELEYTPDFQNWIQPSMSDSDFVCNVIRSANVANNGLPYYAITLNKSLIFRTAESIKAINNPIIVGDGQGYVPYLSIGSPFQAQLGGLNGVSKYGSRFGIYRPSKNEVDSATYKPNPDTFLSTSEYLYYDTQVRPSCMGVTIDGGNTYKSYYEQSVQNLQDITTAAQFLIKVELKNQPTIAVLDHIRLIVPDISNRKEGDTILSGDYVVVERRLNLTGQDIISTLILARQSIN